MDKCSHSILGATVLNYITLPRAMCAFPVLCVLRTAGDCFSASKIQHDFLCKQVQSTRGEIFSLQVCMKAQMWPARPAYTRARWSGGMPKPSSQPFNLWMLFLCWICEHHMAGQCVWFRREKFSKAGGEDSGEEAEGMQWMEYLGNEIIWYANMCKLTWWHPPETAGIRISAVDFLNHKSSMPDEYVGPMFDHSAMVSRMPDLLTAGGRTSRTSALDLHSEFLLYQSATPRRTLFAFTPNSTGLKR